MDNVLNDALCIVAGCLRPTPTNHLHILSSIQPAELRQLEATLFLAYHECLDSDHMLHDLRNGSSDKESIMDPQIDILVGSVVEWLKHRTDDQHGLGSKPTCATLLCPWERHFTTPSPAWWS